MRKLEFQLITLLGNLHMYFLFKILSCYLTFFNEIRQEKLALYQWMKVPGIAYCHIITYSRFII